MYKRRDIYHELLAIGTMDGFSTNLVFFPPIFAMLSVINLSSFLCMLKEKKSTEQSGFSSINFLP